MKQYLEIGKIVASQGIKGEVRVQPWCDSPDFLTGFRVLYFDGGKRAVKVEKARVQKNIAVLKLEGVDSMDGANLLREKILWCNRDDADLGESTYFIQDLIGLKVVDADDGTVCYGTLTDVSATGANDVYHIEKDGNTYLLPAIRQVVIETDVKAGVMRIRPLKGIFDEEEVIRDED